MTIPTVLFGYHTLDILQKAFQNNAVKLKT